MIKRWNFREIPDDEKTSTISDELKINKILATILVQRGIDSFDKAREFFNPDLKNLHDPFLMMDMEVAVTRLNTAIAKEQKILIYGDYDVDGTTAVALVYGYLSKHYHKLDFYIPDRYTEGYGISEKAVQWAENNGFELVISLDCGIKAVDQVRKAKEAGIDFIICDHHKPGAEVPDAVAILDPQRADCNYPFDELTGCGVGFKLMQAFCIKNNINQTDLFRNLDLLCISIASDIVPINGENRILAYFGLKILSKDPGPGLQALINISGLTGEIDISGIVFGLGPRINAAGRINHASDSVRLLLAPNEKEAMEFANRLNIQNLERRDFDASITEEALEMIESSDRLKEAKSTVLYKPDWHKGVIGIVASRCIEKYYRPTIILTESEGKITGSARSVNGFDLYQAISECNLLLEKFGGHKYAAGLTLSMENIEPFKEKFEEVVRKNIRPDQLIPKINIDTPINLNDITGNLFKIIKRMAPFGPENMPPVFCTCKLRAGKSARLLKDQHIKMFVREEEGAKQWEAIAFRMPEYFEEIKEGKPFDMAYTIGESEYMGNKYLQLVVKDIRFADQKLEDNTKV